MNKPNIIIIVVDALRKKNMKLYGYNNGQDQNICKIASESIVFNNAVTASNTTVPSLTSLFTAKYPINNGIIHQWPYTTQEEINNFNKNNNFWFPSFLKNKGYRTIAIDWLRLWFKQGFNEFIEPKNKIKDILQSRILQRLFLKLPSKLYTWGKKITKVQSSASYLFPSPEETTNLAISKINAAEKPFFLFLHYWDTHFPYKSIKNPPSGGENKIKDLINKIECRKQREFMEKRFKDVSLTYIEEIKAKYDLSIKEVDNQIGRIYTHLKDNRLMENTILIILADHGDCIDEHNSYFDHHCLYDNVVTIPLIMKLPGKNPKVINEQVQNIDIIPTLTELLKNKISEIDGISLLPIIYNKEKGRDYTVTYDALSKNRVCVRDNKNKVIFTPNNDSGKCFICGVVHTEKEEAYDLIKDGEEKNNSLGLFNKLKLDFLAKLEKIKRNIDQKSDLIAINTKKDEEIMKKRLEALGYL